MAHSTSSRGAMPLNATNIGLARRGAGWSLNQLAERAGMSSSHLSRSLAGDNWVSPDIIRKLRAAFGNRIEWEEMIDWDQVPAEPVGDTDDTALAAADNGGQ
jgi:transcriptional regulator with XRE-family HTH domain